MARLIDADALIAPLKLQMESYDRIGACERAEAYRNCIWEINEAPTIDGWISVKDRLPEIDERVLVFGVGKYDCFIGTTQIAITYMSDRNLIDCHRKTQPYWIAPWQYFLTDYEITHWMFLPEGPKEDDVDATD